jgi:hypothetical protein
MLILWWWFGICNYELFWKNVDELMLKDAWDLYCEWWHDVELVLSIAWDLCCEYDIC